MFAAVLGSVWGTPTSGTQEAPDANFWLVLVVQASRINSESLSLQAVFAAVSYARILVVQVIETCF